MERDARAQGGEITEATEAVAEGVAHVSPRIDVSPALHSAGHEVHDLGFDDVPDDGPVLHPDRDPSGPEDPLDHVTVRLPSD